MSFRDRVSGVAATEPPPPPSSFQSSGFVGRTIDGRYRVESLLGEGGMGAVFLAEHIKLSKKVALKVILPQFAGDGDLAERFAREAMASAKLDHPHVASALDYGALPEGGAYLVMPYVRGRSLRSAMEGSHTGWRFACEIGSQIADALSAAHAHRIVHRDLKPENVILEPREDGSELVKVLDFGVARVAGDDAQSGAQGRALTRVGTIIGTPGYMAPEQALGESVDVRADIYALGVVLWEIVAKKQLFPEDDLTAIVTRQLTSAPPRLATLAADVPPELDELIARMLSRSRDERPERAGEVRDTLQRLTLGAAIERKMLSGEIALPSDITQSARLVGVAATMHSARSTDARNDASRPSLVLPPAFGHAATKLGGSVDLGPLRNVPVSLLLVGCATPIAAATLLLVLTLVFSGGDDPAVATITPGVDPTGTVVEPEPQPEPPVMEQLAERIVAAVSPGAAIPSEIADDVTTLLEDEQRDDRAAAAERIRSAAVTAPAFVTALVDLELADSCRDRRTAVQQAGTAGDARALPALERLDRNRRGCGFLGSQDCNRCLRRDLRDTLRTLRGTE